MDQIEKFDWLHHGFKLISRNYADLPWFTVPGLAL